jgi:hypothetical protein
MNYLKLYILATPKNRESLIIIWLQSGTSFASIIFTKIALATDNDHLANGPMPLELEATPHDTDARDARTMRMARLSGLRK